MAVTRSSGKTSRPPNALQLLEQIKRLAVVAMFSDDELLDHLVLKGGNAMDLIHRLSTRASIDLDFSMQLDFPEGLEGFPNRVERALRRTFQPAEFEVFDVKMEEKPRPVQNDEMAGFWGGYAVEFKLIPSELYRKYQQGTEELRKYGLTIGQGKKFLIVISRFEYTTGKLEAELDGYRIYVYSPAMIVCENIGSRAKARSLLARINAIPLRIRFPPFDGQGRSRIRWENAAKDQGVLVSPPPAPGSIR